MPNTLDNLVKVRKWLSTPAHWIKGSMRKKDFKTGKVCATCLVGAILNVVGKDDDAMQHTGDAIRPYVRARGAKGLVTFNDAPRHHAQGHSERP